MPPKPDKSIEQIAGDDGRYAPQAFHFVREGLHYAIGKYHPEAETSKISRHVSGHQVCDALRELALKRWGLLTRTVLRRWNINSTRDFGEIVFLLVENGWMQKEPTDCIENFDEVYDFTEAFERNFEISLDQ